MKLRFLDIAHQENLISGVKLRKLIVHKDSRGTVSESFRLDWKDIVSKKMAFAQSYYSITYPKHGRDIDTWHYHPKKLVERIIIIKGTGIFALYDWRKSSKTHGTLNLFLMGEQNREDSDYLLVIPRNVLHSFYNIGNTPCFMIAYVSHLYDPKDQKRISFDKVPAKFPDGTAFSWKKLENKL